jgi:serpin B
MAMKAFVLILSVMLLLITGACPAGTGGDAAAAGPAGVEDIPALAEGNTQFALDIFQVLCSEEPSGNLFFSPFSISTALGMTYAGAEGNTADQMASVLGFDMPAADVHASFHGILEKMTLDYRQQYAGGDAEPLVLEIANALWVDENFRLLTSYTDLVETEYGAVAENVDFMGDPDGARLAINGWVAEKTRDRIRDLLGPGVITGDTRVVLTNAVYFKGSWLHQFDGHATFDADFHLAGGSSVSVPFMHETEAFAYGTGYGCTAVSLPYGDGMSSMIVMLPDGDLNEFEASLDGGRLDAIRDGLWRTRVALAMPSFEFTSSFGLKETLESMGMTDAFSQGAADFSGFTGSPDLCISAVIHKAFVKVDETGTEAAAATAVVMMITSAAPEPEPVRVNLDRPFVFVIVDDLTGSILFMGRVADPS